MTIVGLGKEAVFQTNQKNSERYREVFEQWERFKKTAFHIYEEEKLQHSAVGPVLFGGFSFDPCEEEVHNGTISRKGISLCLRLC